MSGFEKGFNAFIAGLILVAAFHVLVQPGSQGPQLLESGGKGLGSALYAAQGMH